MSATPPTPARTHTHPQLSPLGDGGGLPGPSREPSAPAAFSQRPYFFHCLPLVTQLAECASLMFAEKICAISAGTVFTALEQQVISRSRDEMKGGE